MTEQTPKTKLRTRGFVVAFALSLAKDGWGSVRVAVNRFISDNLQDECSAGSAGEIDPLLGGTKKPVFSVGAILPRECWGLC